MILSTRRRFPTRMARLSIRLFVGLALGFGGSVATARAESRFAPDSTAETLARIRLRCHLSLTCPLNAKDYALYNRAMAGDHDAEYQFGEKLELGQGVPRDHEAAEKWLDRAAEGGSVRAATALNRMAAQGLAVHADNQKIVQALRVEASRGDGGAQRALSEMYYSGRGVGRDER
jgi:TPR repeat protein